MLKFIYDIIPWCTVAQNAYLKIGVSVINVNRHHSYETVGQILQIVAARNVKRSRGRTTLSTWLVRASTTATTAMPETTVRLKLEKNRTKMICDKTDARVPSKVFGDPGNLNRPNFDPTMLAAESPMPIEMTPLNRTTELVLFKSKNYCECSLLLSILDVMLFFTYKILLTSKKNYCLR